jgi:hypothetical protein
MKTIKMLVDWFFKVMGPLLPAFGIWIVMKWQGASELNTLIVFCAFVLWGTIQAARDSILTAVAAQTAHISNPNTVTDIVGRLEGRMNRVATSLDNLQYGLEKAGIIPK